MRADQKDILDQNMMEQLCENEDNKGLDGDETSLEQDVLTPMKTMLLDPLMLHVLSRKKKFLILAEIMEIKTLLNLKKIQINTTTKTVEEIISANLQ